MFNSMKLLSLLAFVILVAAAPSQAKKHDKGGSVAALSTDEPSAGIFSDTKLLKKADNVGLAAYRVHFSVSDQAGAVTESGRGAKAKLGIKLKGVDEALMQEITEAAYKDLLERLSKTGRTIVASDKIKGHPKIAKLEAFKSPKENKHIIICSPVDLPLIAFNSDQWNGVDWGHKAAGALQAAADENNAVLIVPEVTVDFATVQGSGHTWFGAASVEGKADLRIAGAHSYVDFYTKNKFAHSKMTAGFHLDTGVGSLEKVSAKTEDINGNTSASGMGDWKTSKSEYDYTITDAAKYKAEILKGLIAFNESLAQAVAESK